MSDKILIVGAGIAGLCLARQLKQAQIAFTLIEKNPAEIIPRGAGIALPANAVKILRHLGLGAHIDRQAHPVHQIIYTDMSGTTLSAASLLEPPLNIDRFVALPRHVFHTILATDLIPAIHFETTITEMQQTEQGVNVKFNSKLPAEKFSAVIGADGINSSVRQFAFADFALTDLGVTVWRWRCRYPTQDLQPTYMLGREALFMAYPIGPEEVYCYAHLVDRANADLTSTQHQTLLTKYFSMAGGIAKKMLAILPGNSAIIASRLRSVAKPCFANNRIALIGDAAHACSPMLQQGAAGALEDVIALVELLKHFPAPLALTHYANFRAERVNWIVATSDNPLKMFANMDEKMQLMLEQTIREKGPLNVQGWKKLFATDPVSEIASYIQQQTSILS